jgi:hypothetical protein
LKETKLPIQAERICGKALVGTGKIGLTVGLPEQGDFNPIAPFQIFNGHPKGGRPVVIFYLSADLPAPATYVVTGAVANTTSGPYGTTVSFNIPPLVQGHGTVTSIEYSIDKTWIYRGNERSYLLASCPRRDLRADAELTFDEGTDLSSTLEVPCTPSG